MGYTKIIRGGWWIGLMVAAVAAPGASAGAHQRKNNAHAQLHSEKTGSLETHRGMHLRLTATLGSVVLHAQDAERVDYRVSVFTDSDEPDAQQLLKNFYFSARSVPDGVLLEGHTVGNECSGRLWITFDVTIPRDYNVDVNTGGGNINAGELRGRVVLSSAGGNIRTGDIAGPGRIQTAGGHITFGNVGGELNAETGGGHITGGIIKGAATLHTSGGHIRVASIEGVARLDTGGGNISLENSGVALVAETGGGQIVVGQASGIVHARNGGGGIRVVKMNGPTDLQTGAGSIYLTNVESPVRAMTGAGAITAWFGPQAKILKPCILQSGQGDIVVYLPRELPITIDAAISLGDQNHFSADPAFPIKVSFEGERGTGNLHATGSLNGGGEVLRLRTTAGNIRLELCDVSKQIQNVREQLAQLEQQLRERMLQAEKQEKDQD